MIFPPLETEQTLITSYFSTNCQITAPNKFQQKVVV